MDNKVSLADFLFDYFNNKYPDEMAKVLKMYNKLGVEDNE